MIQMQTNLDWPTIQAHAVSCVSSAWGLKRRYATVGDIIVVSIKEAIPRGKVKKGDVMKPSWCGSARTSAVPTVR